MVKNFLKITLSNPVLANMLMLMIFFAGITGGITMIKETFPRFSLDVITVSVEYPGADPEEIEEGICLKLEEALEGIEGVKEVLTEANEGMGTATIECEDNADVYRVKDDVKTLVDAITTFPVDAEKPVVKEVKFRGSVCDLILSGDIPERQLKELARKIENEILQLKEVTQTSVSGVRDYEISIEIPEKTLRKYNISFEQIKAEIARQGINLPAGSIKTDAEDFRIRAVGRRYRAKDYENIPIIRNSSGTIITLGQIAEIKDSFNEDDKKIAVFNGKPAARVGIYKTEDEDVLIISEAIDNYLKAKKKELPPNVSLTKFHNRARMVTGRLNILKNNGIFGLILVFLSLWIFLDLRLSFWVTMGIPISLAGALGIMAMMGESINMLSMFGMIMVLGIIVDDAIVVGESIYAKRQNGQPPYEAAVNGTAEVALPVIAAVFTTIVAFIPLFYIGGVMGKFIRQIPIPVVTALAISLVEGLFILPVHLRHLPVPGEKPKIRIFKAGRIIHGFVSEKLNYFIEHIYGPFIDTALHMRYIAFAVAVAILLIVLGLVQGGIIKFIFFPEIDDDFIRAQIEFPDGTPIAATKAAARKVVEGWKKVEKKHASTLPEGKKLTVGLYALIGGKVRFDPGGGKSNELDVLIELLPAEERHIYFRDLISEWQKATGDIPGTVSTKFQAIQRGPGGNPIEIKLMGNNREELLKAAGELKNKLSSMKGVFDEQIDYRPGKREFIIDIKPEAAHLGLSLYDIASHVRGGFYGAEALRIQRGRDDVKVKVRYPEKEGRNSIEHFQKLKIKTPTGKMLPFTSVADIKLTEGQSTIKRKNRKRTVNVSADVNEKEGNAKDIMDDLEARFLPKLMSKYEVSYKIEGQSEERRDSFKSMFVTFPLALFGIYFIIASMFRSYIQPVVIMTTIPFGLIGGIIGHIIFGRALTIMSFFGMVALAGIVVNDAIVLIEGINMRLDSGMPFLEAIREGGKRRFRAILLTTITTFFGLMPMILEKSMQAQFLIPMAISIAFGVAFATLLTLILIPCLLAILNDIRRICHFAWFLKMPSREAVEPRSESRT